MKKNILIKCKYCKKKFKKYRLPKYGKRKFCSKNCASKFNNIKRIKIIYKKCNYCGNNFRLTYENDSRKYCSYDCCVKNRKKGMYNGIVLLRCEYCNKKIKKYKSTIKNHQYCNKECYLKAIYAKVQLKCNNCNKNYLYNRKMSVGYKLHFCSIKCRKQYFKKYWPLKGNKNPAKQLNARKKIRKAKLGIPRFDMRGEKNWAWMGGISNHPYSFDFNNELKEKIRKRDNHKCQLCGAPQLEFVKKLPVHHIDYDKNNSDPINLITLCIGCNFRVNKNRDYWEEYFKKLIKERTLR